MEKENYEEEFEEADVGDINMQYYDPELELENFTTAELSKTDYSFEIKQVLEPTINYKECPNKNL